jgi:hypothetical protein
MSRKSAYHVVVLTGNEKQAKRSAAIQELVDTESNGMVSVELITPDWSRNWGRVLKGFSRSLAHADAVVLGTYVPTELGAAARQEVRRLNMPHVRTSKLGQHGLAAAILEAVELVEAA